MDFIYATFENTIAALDRAGEALGRATGLFFNILECDATPEMQEMANTIQPLVIITKNVSRHCHTSPWGGKHPDENLWSR